MLQLQRPFRRLAIAVLLLCATATAMANIADTSDKKNSAIPNRRNYTLSENLTGLPDAISAFKADSTEKGIHLLAVILRDNEQQYHLSRMGDYNSREVSNFIAEADAGELSAAEKQLFGRFMEAVVKQDNAAARDLENELKKMPASSFMTRFRLFDVYSTDEKQAGQVAEKLLKDKPDDITLNVLRAEVLFDFDKYDESIKYCDKLTNLWPQYAYAFELRARNYQALGQPEKAVIDYDQAIRLFPTNRLVPYHRSTALMDLDKYKEAIPGLLHTFSFNPDYIWTTYNLARCYYKTDMPDSALYFVNIHLQQHPDDDDGYDLKGDLYYDRDDYANAVDLYNQAIHLSPAREIFYEDRGNAYFYDQKYSDALTDFLKAVQLDKHRAFSADRVSDCYYQLKEYKKAISYDQMAVKDDPAYKGAYVGLSMSKVEIGDYKGAVADCSKAVAIDSTYEMALGDLGWAYYCAGDNDACIAYSYKALHYDETATYAMFNIALATLKKGESEKAKQLYREFIAKCRDKGYTISDGAVDDLKDLMKHNIAVDDCKYIITQLFGKEL